MEGFQFNSLSIFEASIAYLLSCPALSLINFIFFSVAPLSRPSFSSIIFAIRLTKSMFVHSFSPPTLYVSPFLLDEKSHQLHWHGLQPIANLSHLDHPHISAILFHSLHCES